MILVTTKDIKYAYQVKDLNSREGILKIGRDIKNNKYDTVYYDDSISEADVKILGKLFSMIGVSLVRI